MADTAPLDEAVGAARAVAETLLPPDVAELAEQCLLDWVAVTVRGSGEPLVERLHGIVRDGAPAGPHGATAIGWGGGLATPGAALLNAAAAHALDCDDTNAGPFHGHATAPVLSAAMALGEARGAAPETILRAFVAGVECGARLGARANPAHYDAGWHATATIGTFGATAACAALIGLDAAGWRSALGLAAVQSAGLTAAFGGEAKPFQVGKAAANGALAALLAEQGLEASPELVDGERGFLALHGARPGAWAQAPYAIRRTRFKRHAACHGTHAAIDAAARLRRAGADPAGVAAVTVTVAPSLLAICDVASPATGLEAKFSLRTVTAMALLGRDTSDPAAFGDVLVRDPAVSALAARVVVSGDRSLSEWQARVEVEHAHGTASAERADLDGAAIDLPEQRATLERKFDALVAPVRGAAGTATLRLVLDGFLRGGDVRVLAAALGSVSR